MPTIRMDNMTFKIRCLVSFSDFTIFPRKIKQGEVLEVNENVYKRLISSGGKFEVIEKLIPQPEKEAKRAKA